MDAMAGVHRGAWRRGGVAGGYRRSSLQPVIGYLSINSEQQVKPQLSAFRQGLNETGFAEGRNVEIEYRWTEGQYQRPPAMAEELVSRPVLCAGSAYE
jgi:putative ABC transport system substrate-binding protein